MCVCVWCMYIRCMHVCIYVCMLNELTYVCLMYVPLCLTSAMHHRRSYLFLCQFTLGHSLHC